MSHTSRETEVAAEITTLLNQLNPPEGEGLIDRVSGCAGDVDEINELERLRDAASTRHQSYGENVPEEEDQSLQEQIENYNKKIEELFGPFQLVKSEVRAFVSQLENVLRKVPMDPPELREIRSEIETEIRSPGLLSMQKTLGNLRVVEIRLNDLLERLKSVDGASQQARRKRRKKAPRTNDDPMAQQKALIRQMKKEGASQADMVERLDGLPRPPRAAWRALPWDKAFYDPKYSPAVKRWISGV